jgi:hypothetical protein
MLLKFPVSTIFSLGHFNNIGLKKYEFKKVILIRIYFSLLETTKESQTNYQNGLTKYGHTPGTYNCRCKINNFTVFEVKLEFGLV